MPRGVPLPFDERIDARRRRQREYEARCRISDPDGFAVRQKASTRRYRERHPERAADSMRRYLANEEHRANRNAVRKEWRKRNIAERLWDEAKRRAKKKGREFTVAFEDVPKMGDCCPILGTPFTTGEHWATSPSLDRIDSSRGYVPGNVWFISRRANTVKSDGTPDEHEAIAAAMRAAMAAQPGRL